MNVSCPECRSVFRVDPAKLPSATVRARCSVCGGVITVTAGSTIEDEFAATSVSARPTRLESEAPAGPRGNAGLSTALLDTLPSPPPRAPTPAPAMPAVRAAPEPARSAAPVANNALQVTKPLNSSGAPQAPSAAPRPVLFPPRPMMPGAAPGASGAANPRPVAPRPIAAPASNPSTSANPAPGKPSFVTANAPPAVPPTTAQVAKAPVAPTSAPVAAIGTARSAAPATAPSGAPPAARTPINPFLANDPHAKAKRLARALVSDLVTYFPQKRQDGLRDGTLKQLFKDEIQKSYEEYIAQVGREFAESTPHFQDALNDLLAGGQRVF